VKEIDEKVKDIALTITQWRILFAINENTEIDQIAKYVEESKDSVLEALKPLLEKELIFENTPKEDENDFVSGSSEEAIEEELIEESFEDDFFEDDSALEIETDEVEDVFEDEVMDVSEIEEEDIFETEDAEIEIFDESNEDGSDEIIEEELIEVGEESIEIFDETENTLEEEEESIEIVEDIEEQENEVQLEEQTVEEVLEIEEESTSEVEKEQTVSGNTKTIVVIDESIVIRKMVEIAFEDLGMAISDFANGEEAKEKIDTVSPHLVIIDSALKDVKSIELMNIFKEKFSAPVIMFGTKTNPQLSDAVTKAGADAVVNKPFNDADLIEKVQSLLK
jgi:CheY-like chemotaxis protein